MMTVYESMAHAIVNEHGRELFLNKNLYGSTAFGFRARFWRWLLLAYGEQLYELPKQMGLPPITAGERKLPYNFPAFTVLQSMRCGLAPTELLKYPTMGGFDHQYSPLHLGTALIKHGREDDLDEANVLLSASFLKSVYQNRTASAFTGHAYINPWAPEDLGRRPFDIELLQTPTSELQIVDELGNAAWFPTEYLEKIFRQADPVFWYSKLCQLNGVHGRWTPQVQQCAGVLLRKQPLGVKKNEYRNRTNYVRNATRASVDSYFRTLSGVSEMLCLVRGDASAEEMARGLKTLATTNSERAEEMYRFIGRELTVEDFQRLTAKQALTILYFAPYATVKSVIAAHPTDLGAMFFTLTDAKTLPMVTNSMSDHSSREKLWYPDTEEGNLRHLLSTNDVSKEYFVESWTKTMQPLAESYGRTKPWRDLLVQLAPPEVLMLALCRWAGRAEDDPVPTVAIENVLRSHPNIIQVQEMIAAMPEDILKLSAL